MGMEQRISLVTLGVKDLGRERAFYEAMGWSGASQPDDEVCFFQVGGMVFGLWTALGGHGAPGVELAYNHVLVFHNQSDFHLNQEACPPQFKS